MGYSLRISFASVVFTAALSAQSLPVPLVLRADRVFDGDRMQQGWAVVVRGDRIESQGRRPQ